MLIFKPMNKNKISERFKGLTVGLVCSVLLVGGIVLASTYYADTVNVYQNGESEENLGGITFEVEDFVEGFKVNSEWVRDTDNLGYYNISVAGNFDNSATTTGETGEWGTTTFAFWQNPNSEKDVIVEDLYLDVTEAFYFNADGLKCSTTTSKGSMPYYPNNVWTASSTDTSSGLTIIASTTIGTTFNSKNISDGFIGVNSHPGTAFPTVSGEGHASSTDKFVLGGDEFIVCTWNLDANATSTASTIPVSEGGGFTGAIKLKGKAFLREE